MTVLDNAPRDQYTATGGQTVFPYTFEIAAAGDIKVLQNGTLLNQGAGAGEYAVSGVGVDTGGNITLVTGATSGDIITIYRDMAYERLTAYTNAGDFLAADVNNDFDRLWLALQQNGGDLDRVLIAPNTDPTSIDMTIPAKADREGKFLSFDSVTGNPTATAISDVFGSGTLKAYNFVGNGSTTAFTLGSDPGVENNTQVYIDGVYQQKNGYTVSGTTLTFSAAPPNLSTIEVMVIQPTGVNTTDAASVSFTQAGSNDTRTVQAKLEESVSVKDFGAVCDGVTDDSAAVQAAIDYCAANDWPTLVVNGKCRIVTSLIINRLVDSTVSEFIIFGQGPEAGFYTDGNVTIFTSTLPYTTDPQSEFITFENIRFESSSFFNQSYVLSENFLRIKFVNCYFYLIRCILSTLYVQTLYFLNCNIRNNPASFVNCVGLYDVTFTSCIIENGQTIVRSVDLVRGTSGLRFVDSVIEGIQGGSVVVATGLNGFNLTGCHLESNFTPDFNFWGGTITNKSILISGNYIYNPNGESFYYGPTTAVVSSGNTVFPSAMHNNMAQVVDLVSIQDNCTGGVSDATYYSTVNGVYRAGNDNTTWVDPENQIVKDITGHFGIGIAVQSANRLSVAGEDQTSANSTATFFDSAGNVIMNLRNDRLINMPALGDYADDTAASAAGVPVGFLYRTGSVVKIRVS
jgi:hypothetical protein